MTQEEMEKILHAMCKSTTSALNLAESKETMTAIALKDALFMKMLFEDVAPNTKPPRKVKEIIKALRELMDE